MHLLYVTFGENISNHIQARFSICTFLYQKQQNLSIDVLTDQPSFYNNLENKINIIKADEQLLEDWKGAYNFFWRIKIKAIEMMCAKYENEPIVYLDSDTFVYHDITQLKQELEAGTASMHEDEGRLSNAKSKTERTMWSQVRNKPFGNFKILDSHNMWNAGVVATPNKKGGKEMADALKICDDMCKQGVTRRLIEQFALSVALSENYGLTPAHPYIAHYWSNKEAWDKVITRFFIEAYLKSETLNELVEHIGSFNFSSLPIKQRVKNTRVRFEKLLQKVYPNKNVAYLNKQQE